MKKCHFCKESFTPNMRHQKYCSLQCVENKTRKQTKKRRLANIKQREKENIIKWAIKYPEILRKQFQFVLDNLDDYRYIERKRNYMLGIKYDKNHFPTTKSETREYCLFRRHLRRARFEQGGELTLQTIHKVYTENIINNNGVLRCIYCHRKLTERKLTEETATLEHKQPISRGGTNNKDNLAIACKRCNYQKCNKTVEEFKDFLRKHRKRYYFLKPSHCGVPAISGVQKFDKSIFLRYDIIRK